jgi:hypothetical protein
MECSIQPDSSSIASRWMVKKICGFSAKRSIATRFNRRRTPCLPRQKEKFSIVEIILPNIIAVSPSQVQKKRSSTKQFTTPLPSMEYRIIHTCGNNYEICWTRTRRGLDRVDFYLKYLSWRLARGEVVQPETAVFHSSCRPRGSLMPPFRLAVADPPHA